MLRLNGALLRALGVGRSKFKLSINWVMTLDGQSALVLSALVLTALSVPSLVGVLVGVLAAVSSSDSEVELLADS